MYSVLESHIADLLKQFCISQPEELLFPFEVLFEHVGVTFDYKQDSPGKLFLYASLGCVKESTKLVAYESLLDANLLWCGTGGATIGVNSQTLEATIAYSFDFSNVAAGGLIKLLEQFVALVVLWRCFIAEL